MSEQSVIRQILELARWAPSGDNTQCWRFELVDASRFVRQCQAAADDAGSV